MRRQNTDLPDIDPPDNAVDRELVAQLDGIRDEEVPERLLELAHRLQQLLRQRQG